MLVTLLHVYTIREIHHLFTVTDVRDGTFYSCKCTITHFNSIENIMIVVESSSLYLVDVDIHGLVWDIYKITKIIYKGKQSKIVH